MRRSLLLFVVAASACASSDRPPRTEVAIAPPVVASTSATPVVAAPDAGAENSDELFDVMMNADKPPNNESEDALLIQMMTPTNVHHGPPVVHVSRDTTEAAGQRAVIRRVLRQNAARFRACYEKGLATKPNLAGRVVVRFKIEASGNVTQTESATGTTLPSPDVLACVVDAIKPLVFPQSRGGALIVNYPIVFAP